MALTMTGPILIAGETGQLAVALAGSGAAPMVCRCVAPGVRCWISIAQTASPQVFRGNCAIAGGERRGLYRGRCGGGRCGRRIPRQPRRAGALATLCEAAGVPLIHVSTDYVFDGHKGAPYVETDPTAPQGVYGVSKLAGERAVADGCRRSIVLRTSWVYSATGKNFVRTMLGAAQRTGQLRVVADQIGCPTSASDLAQAILGIADRLAADGWRDRYAGVYHAAGTGWTTWHGLATATFAAAARYGIAIPMVDAITTDQWPTRAARPPDSRLDCGKLAAVFGLRLPPWQEGLARTIDTIYATAATTSLQTAG